MVRYLIATACVAALLSGPALAATGKSVTIEKTPYGKSITKQAMTHHGKIITKNKKIAGNTMSRSRTITDPVTGKTVTRSRTIER